MNNASGAGSVTRPVGARRPVDDFFVAGGDLLQELLGGGTHLVGLSDDVERLPSRARNSRTPRVDPRAPSSL